MKRICEIVQCVTASGDVVHVATETKDMLVLLI